MLSEKEILSAEANIQSYQKDGLLRKEPFRGEVFETYKRNNIESLNVAQDLFDRGSSPLWVIVVSYYSMFYVANAVLCKLGYKVGSRSAHTVTRDALIVFVRNKLKAQLIVSYEQAGAEALSLTDTQLENYGKELGKRSILQYESTEDIKMAKAKTSLERAKEFSKEIEKLL